MTAPGQPEDPPSLRASEQDRDIVAERLQAAYAERRLDDEEFHRRLRAALTASTHAELEPLTADLPAATAKAAPVHAGEPGRFAVAYKASVRRGGRWRVPDRLLCVVYKGTGLLDLREAELTGPVTTFRVVAYKSRIDILLPPGVRVEAGGVGTSSQTAAAPADAPVLVVKGVGYKGSIEARTEQPQELPAPQHGRAVGGQ